MKTKIVEALTIEENLENVIINYIEFEKEVYALNLEGMIRGNGKNVRNFFDERRVLNRYLANLLASSRTYLDHLERIASTRPQIKKIISKEFDSNLEYRFVYKLRNYIQHYDIAIHKMVVGSFVYWDNVDENPLCRTNASIELLIERDRLIGDFFPKQILDPNPVDIPLIRYLRVFLSCLLFIHQQVRELLEFKNLLSNFKGVDAGENEIDLRKIGALKSLMEKTYPNDAIRNRSIVGVK